MNIAIILAGGVGSRLGAEKPKQYIEVLGKPIIVYTLEKFQESEHIDAIEVVCHDQYQTYIHELAEKYGITKLKWYASAGATCQESISNGVFSLEGKCSEGDIIVIHMSVSPLVSGENIREGIELCKKKGNAFPYHANLIQLCKNCGTEYADENAYKDDYWALNMPWVMEFSDINSMYRDAYARGLGKDARSYLPSLMFDLKRRLYLYPDNEENRLKITTKTDLAFFEGYLLVQKNRKEKAE